jgi:hypothetical protein
MHIYLANGRPCQLASIFDVESDDHFAVSRRGQFEVAIHQLHVSIRSGNKPELEHGVTAPESERECALGSTGCVKPPVSDVEAFGVDGSDGIAEFDVFVVIERHGPCDGELSTRIAFAKDCVGDSCPTFISSKERLE